MTVNILLFVLALLATIGGIALIFVDGMYFVGIIVALGGCYLILDKGISISIDRFNMAFDNLRFDFDSGILYLEKRARVNRVAVYMKRINLTYLKYNEAELEFNSATVGGVTVGGLHVNPAHYSVKNEWSNKYGLYFTDGGDHAQIKKIVLTDSLRECAENKPIIKEMLINNCIVLEGTTSSGLTGLNMQVAQLAKKEGRKDVASYAMARMAADKGISKAQAKAVHSWLKGIG